MGQWSSKENEDMILIQNGLSLSLKEDKWIFKNSRGFSKSETEHFTLEKDKLRVRTLKPYHLIEALKSHRLEEVNRFLPVSKEYELNAEGIRVWLDKFSKDKLVRSLPFDDIVLEE